MPEVRKGSCLCGAVRYTVEGPPKWVGNCHCSICRRHHGAAFGTYAGVDADRFTMTDEQNALSTYVSSPGVKRQFCSRCGSSLFFLYEKDPSEVALTLATFDADAGMAPSSHIFVGSKAPWVEIRDDIPRFDTFPSDGISEDEMPGTLLDEERGEDR